MSLIDELRKTDYLIRHHRPAHEVDQPILSAAQVSVLYENGAALKDVSFELRKGERLAVVGPNGAGKSTLFRVIAGVMAPTKGQIHIYGHEPGGHICIAYLTQRSQVDWTFPVSVADVVMMGRIGKLGLFRRPGPADREIIRRALEMVNLDYLADRQISQLSGGQQQRMFIARALAQEAELILMDEPLTGLDLPSQEEIFRILDDLAEQGVTVLVAIHDLDLAATHFERIMLLNQRLVALGKPADVLTPQNLVTAYGGHLHLIDTQEGVMALGDTCCNEGEFDR